MAAAASCGSPMRLRACMAVLAFSAASLPAHWVGEQVEVDHGEMSMVRRKRRHMSRGRKKGSGKPHNQQRSQVQVQAQAAGSRQQGCSLSLLTCDAGRHRGAGEAWGHTVDSDVARCIGGCCRQRHGSNASLQGRWQVAGTVLCRGALWYGSSEVPLGRQHTTGRHGTREQLPLLATSAAQVHGGVAGDYVPPSSRQQRVFQHASAMTLSIACI